MAGAFIDYATSLQKKIRKCRKKLRQIEGLEILKRHLSTEEEEKVLRKVDIRADLQYLISEYEANANQNSSKTDIAAATSEDSSFDDSNMKRSHSNDSVKFVGNSDPALIQFTTEDSTPEKVSRYNSAIPIGEVNTKDVENTDSNPMMPDHKSHDDELNVKQEKKPTPDEPKKTKVKKLWTKTSFLKTPLAGHSDLVLSVDCDHKYIISASRDTTVRIWNSSDGKELNDLRGHTGAVSSVILLSDEESQNYSKELAIHPDAKTHRLAITGSSDCSIRVWSILSGIEYQSIYTFNGVSAIAYISSLKCILSGTDGGKLELWDGITGYNHDSLHVAEEEIKCLEVCDDKIFCGTSDCILSIYKIKDKKLNIFFTTELEYNATPHYLMNLSVCFEEIYCGDDHPNLKVISWKSGKAHVSKLRNVKSGYGTSDALCIHKDVLISSAFDLDTASASINVRKLPSAEYLYTINCPEENVGRILSISAFGTQAGSIKIVTGGQSLNVWEINSDTSQDSADSMYQNVIYQRELTKPAIDSDNESEPERNESDDDDGEDESDSEEIPMERKVIYQSAQASWYDRWCTIL